MMVGFLAVCLCLCLGMADDDRPCMVVVVGIPGAAEYTGQFERWTSSWKTAADKAGAVDLYRHGGTRRRFGSRPAACSAGRKVNGQPRATLDYLNRTWNL